MKVEELVVHFQEYSVQYQEKIQKENEILKAKGFLQDLLPDILSALFVTKSEYFVFECDKYLKSIVNKTLSQLGYTISIIENTFVVSLKELDENTLSFLEESVLDQLFDERD